MTEIKIEKKQSIWPWIIVVLVLLIVGGYLLLKDRDTDVNDNANSVGVDSLKNYRNDATDTYDPKVNDNFKAAMSEFNSFVGDSIKIGTDSIYTKTAFYKLVRMVVTKADENNILSTESLENLRSYDMQASNKVHTGSISKNLNAMGKDVTSVIESIQNKNFPNLESEVTSLKKISDKLSGNTVLAKQQQTIHNFMMKTIDILNSMNAKN